MKRLSLLTLCIILTSFQVESPTDYILFSGSISNNESSSVLVYGENFRKEITINKDGNFTDTLHIPKKGYFNYKIGGETSAIYLENGYRLYLTIDPKEFDETIKYTGKGASENNFLAQKFLLNEKTIGDPKEHYSLTPVAFREKAVKLEGTLVALLTKLNCSKEFTLLEKTNIHYNYLSSLQSYPSAHKYYTKSEKIDLPDDYLTEIDQIDLDNEEDFQNSDGYKQIVMNNFYSNVSKKANADSITFEKAALSFITTVKSENIKNSMIQSLAYQVRPGNDDAEDLYNAILTVSTDEKFNKKLTDKFISIQTLAKGKPSPTFNYENHKGGKTSLADLKGKYVYIDVWATWCGPCIAEIPSLKLMEEKYHGKNIEFVSISIDQKNDYDKWVKMVNEKELGGIQLLADNDWKSDFVKNYAIEGIPRFILIDPNGNIVTADAARPSDKRLITLFDELGL